jgi:hypothetical protein
MDRLDEKWSLELIANPRTHKDIIACSWQRVGEIKRLREQIRGLEKEIRELRQQNWRYRLVATWLYEGSQNGS